MKSIVGIKSLLPFVLASTLVFSAPGAANAASSGSLCSKLNATKISGTKILKCTKKGKKKVWVSVGIAYGTSGAPAPIGKAIKIGNGNYTLTSVEDGIDEWVCEQNSFNSGCTYDEEFNSVVDPASTKRWVRFNLSVSNLSSGILEPYFGDVGVVAAGKISWQGWRQPSVDGRLDDLTILSRSKDTGSLYVQIPKSVTFTQLVLRPSLWDKNFFFFRTK
jgi:hypothetical protein